MFRREKSIYIAAAPEAVFHYVADIRRHGEWGAQIWNITLQPGSEHGPGTTFAGSDQRGFSVDRSSVSSQRSLLFASSMIAWTTQATTAGRCC
jgi:hypothetical protein